MSNFIRNKPLFLNFFVFTVVLTVTSLAFFNNFKAVFRESSLSSLRSESPKELLRLKNEVDTIRRFVERKKEEVMTPDQIADISETKNYKLIGETNTKLAELDEKFTGLRQAINPLNPDEILTIARIKDSVGILEKKISKLEEEIDKKHETLKKSVIRELDASSRSTNWLFVILIPIILNLLYSIWKDNKDKTNNT